MGFSSKSDRAGLIRLNLDPTFGRGSTMGCFQGPGPSLALSFALHNKKGCVKHLPREGAHKEVRKRGPTEKERKACAIDKEVPF